MIMVSMLRIGWRCAARWPARRRAVAERVEEGRLLGVSISQRDIVVGESGGCDWRRAYLPPPTAAALSTVRACFPPLPPCYHASPHLRQRPEHVRRQAASTAPLLTHTL